jgi:hypothetical protein
MGEIIAVRQMSGGEYDAAALPSATATMQSQSGIRSYASSSPRAVGRRRHSLVGKAFTFEQCSSDCYLVDFWQLLINEPWLVARQPSRV